MNASNGKLTVTASKKQPLEKNYIPLIEVTDGSLAQVAQSSGEMRDRELPAGVYQVRVRSQDGQAFEQMVFVRPKTPTTVEYSVKGGQLSSGAPVPGTKAMHEEIRKPVDAVVARPATQPCRVVLMATHVGIANPTIDLSAFKLRDESGKDLSDIATKVQSAQAGRAKYMSWDLPGGGYVLEGAAEGFDDDKPVRLPLYCSNGWCTLVFLEIQPGTGTPDLSSASIYLWEIGSRFAPEQPLPENYVLPPGYVTPTQEILQSQRSTELALKSLVEGTNLLSADELDAALITKFANPMLGILGCHLLLQQKPLNKPLVAVVLGNLDRLITGHPDLAALKILARRAEVALPADKPLKVSWPPMIYEGLRALREEDWTKPGTIQEGSLFDRIRARVIPGRAWTRWIADKKNDEFSAIPTALIPPKTDSSAWASTVMTVLRGVLSFTNLLDIKGLRTEDFRDSGLSRHQATLAASFANRARPSRPMIAYAKKKRVAVAKSKTTRASSAPAARKKATVARPVAKVGSRRPKAKARARRR
jgi:hypothetical protein